MSRKLGVGSWAPNGPKSLRGFAQHPKQSSRRGRRPAGSPRGLGPARDDSSPIAPNGAIGYLEVSQRHEPQSVDQGWCMNNKKARTAPQVASFAQTRDAL